MLLLGMLWSPMCLTSHQPEFRQRGVAPAYPLLEKQLHRPWPWLHSSRLKTRLNRRYRWRLSTSGSLQIRCSAERTLVRTISNTCGKVGGQAVKSARNNDGN